MSSSPFGFVSLILNVHLAFCLSFGYSVGSSVRRGFVLDWTEGMRGDCERSEARCGFDIEAHTFRCYCPDGNHLSKCVSEEVGRYCCNRKLFSYKIISFWKNKSKAHRDFEAFLRSHVPLATRRYSYSDIKKMTNSFKEKLGQGGYGSVFKGKLHDKCPVAVKVWNETKGNGEEFINEVASISRTSHVNIITLLGFCFEGSKKALVYEFMANGALEKFIYENKNNPLESDHQLSCEILYQIALGVARGLEYLHKGCNTQILHLDIKPQNILLEENFCPNISDFGLVKICLRNESTISMLGPRGTIVISRNFGGVSHKSDVYNFGMLVMETVGARKNVNIVEDGCSSEIYFPHWIYKCLKLNQELALGSIKDEGDKERIRQMVIVSLWCIQIDPSDRPMMSQVVEVRDLASTLETLISRHLLQDYNSLPQPIDATILHVLYVCVLCMLVMFAKRYRLMLLGSKCGHV